MRGMPLCGEPPPKKRFPVVPQFGGVLPDGGPKPSEEERRRLVTPVGTLDPANLSSAEYQRRLKAGLLDVTGTGARAKASSMVTPTARAPDCIGMVGSQPAAPGDAAVGPGERRAAVASAGTDGNPGADAASPPGRTLEVIASGSSAPTPPAAAPPVRAQTAASGAIQSFGGAYGLEAGRLTGIGKKAIALRLEPLKDAVGLFEFERVLSEDRQEVMIGSQRGQTNDIVVTDDVVSKKHVLLSLVGIHGELALSIADLSTNGTFVNDKRLPEKKKRFRIRSGDVLTLKDPSFEENFGWKVDFGNTVAYFSR